MTQEKKHIIELLEGDKPLNMGQVHFLFQQFFALLKDKTNITPEEQFAAMFTPVSSAIQQDIDIAITKAGQISELIIKLEERITDELESSYDRISERWNGIRVKMSQLSKNISETSITVPELKLPYNWKEYFEMCERFARMSPEQQEAFANMCKLLK